MERKQVKVRNMILGDGTPKICIPVTAADMEELKEQVNRICQVPCDMVEWRVDFFRETEKEGWMKDALSMLRDALGERALLFTFRTKEEGGECSISMEDYQAMNEAAADSGLVDFVDLELNRGEELLGRTAKKIQAYGVRVIGSYHDFDKTPDQEVIIGILCKMQELGVDVTKAALMPKEEKDVLALLEASAAMKQQFADRPFITMSMGALGGVSRLCGALTGSALTFATAGKASAPGQMDAVMVAEVLEALQ